MKGGERETERKGERESERVREDGEGRGRGMYRGKRRERYGSMEEWKVDGEWRKFRPQRREFVRWGDWHGMVSWSGLRVINKSLHYLSVICLGRAKANRQRSTVITIYKGPTTSEHKALPAADRTQHTSHIPRDFTPKCQNAKPHLAPPHHRCSFLTLLQGVRDDTHPL